MRRSSSKSRTPVASSSLSVWQQYDDDDDDEIKVGDENTLPRLSSIHFDVKGVEADTFGLSFLRPSRRRGLRL